MAETWKVRPSELLKLEEKYGDYTSYCFDSACMYIVNELKEERTPRFLEDAAENTGLQTLLG
ncbi:hypothetical protein ACFIJ5_17935 (plasmid) [Haloimpatiens sp. FM7330]|uniref:hypothetical protein n=1 Tax=Haloimpatiens sp. FM7330 TaxID=3298610 RepID=UPI00363ADB3D